MTKKCVYCGSIGDHRININGQDFCSWECEHLHNYRPNMTDETYQHETNIDRIELNKNTTIILQTTEAFYSHFSGYKVIAVKYRGFNRPKQIGSYHSVKSAKEDWNRFKKQRKLRSWADKNSTQIKDAEAKRNPKPLEAIV